MPSFCTTHTAYVYDRGGQRVVGKLTPLSLVRWERLRDDVSSATVHIPTRSEECDRVLGFTAAGRHELVIFRGDERVWEGPITLITYIGDRVEIQARDVMHYVYRTALTQEYDNGFPNVATVISRIQTILIAELARKEALDPPINVLPHLTLHTSAEDAKTTAHTRAFESTVFDHIDALAARAGVDYVTVGRAIHLFDVDTPLGRTPPLTSEDFIGEVVITEYGMELVTQAYITDGLGQAGSAGEPDSYYGIWEVVHGAYDENTDPGDDLDPPTVEEMTSQAERIISGSLPTPQVVRIPDGSRLSPLAAVGIRDLVPGVRIPLLGRLPGKTLLRLQKLDRVRVEESGGGEEGQDVGEGVGESIQITLSPAPLAEQ